MQRNRSQQTVDRVQRIALNYVLLVHAIYHVVIKHYTHPESKIYLGEREREKHIKYNPKRSELT